MVILGIHDGHNASAALIKDGRLVCAVSEERFSRVKHHYGFPYKSVQQVLSAASVTSDQIDRVAMSTATLPPAYFYTRRNATFSISDYWLEQKEYWYPKLYENKDPSYLDIFKHRIDENEFPYEKELIKHEADHSGMWKARLRHACSELNIIPEKIGVHDHHDCHAYYGLFTNPNSSRDTLIYTMDGGGDGTNGTVSIGSGTNKIKRISQSDNCNIGRMYRYATLLLGMRPADHEYKLMGLAAYNQDKYGSDAYKVYAETLQVDGLKFKYKKKINDHFFYFKEKLEGQRFDAIAYGVQKFCEDILVEWIKNGIDQTGIKHVVMTGGVAQNIKANKLISELVNLESLHIPPGPGDESISLGAAYKEFLENSNYEEQSKIVLPHNAYFGPAFSQDDVAHALQSYDLKNFTLRKVDLDYVAKVIADGDVVARFGLTGMEFGARALGNRSILADPRRPDVIHHINKLVKMRDFWMPFAPSILAEREHDYMLNPKNISGKYMSVGFASTKLAENDLPAGLHPFDRTARPQIVTKEDNPLFYNLIKAFEDLTGVGAVMNTSFNIHGEPIVGTPLDAIDTFIRCGLHHLLIGDTLVSKP